MKTAFLFIETSPQWPNLVRIGLADTMPATGGPDARQIRYVARFSDAEAALMHTHELLKRRLLDLDRRLYRVSPARAVAAAKSLGLRHSDVYLDPALGDAERARIERLTGQFQARRRRINGLFEWLGYAGIALLLFNLFVLSAP